MVKPWTMPTDRNNPCLLLIWQYKTGANCWVKRPPPPPPLCVCVEGGGGGAASDNTTAKQDLTTTPTHRHNPCLMTKPCKNANITKTLQQNRSNKTITVQWNSVIARADGPGTFSRYCRVLVIPKWRIYQGKQREIILARTPTAPCALEPDEDERRERGRGDYTPHKDAPFVVFRCFTRCALPGTWRRGGASGENFCGQEG